MAKTLRFRKDRDYKGKPKEYKHTYRIVPEDASDLCLFTCDVMGHVASRETNFLDPAGEPGFSMRPNRKIMPTQWFVKDAAGVDIGSIGQAMLSKGKWVGLDAFKNEAFRVIDSESRVDKIGKSLFGGSTSQYSIIQEDRIAATTEKEPREKTTKKGIRGFLQAFATPSDWVLRFPEDEVHLDLRLVVPAMILLIDITVALDAID
ncbi:hypothetical protein [Desulfomonile tiedjei]|uniref:Uncharacterized protein n=1 Tax=Desulfomonile tiedjei (strain ATCC 49306 / DSM 6799 / DCB-1) TaxID=706587 RepID=I4C5E9_DESTA|nr:hypothetical protein [Desulfomonile tiedjei]AFM24790.1 hypothetical protein Desti_2091 [Desulfomonile tiedjei DSM 6799]